jgi:hypothetical protein
MQLNPYRAPATGMDDAAETPSGGGGASVRIAGWFIAVNAVVGLVGAIGWLNGLPEQLRWSAVMIGVLAGRVPFAAIDLLLAAPLIRGSTRFRVLAWIRAGAEVVLPLLMESLRYVAARSHGPGGGPVGMLRLDQLIARTSLYAVAIVLLVTTKPTRWRTVMGVVCVGLYAVSFLR